MNFRKISFLFAGVFFLSACADMGPKQTFGTGTGAVLGGMVGAEIGRDSELVTGLGMVLGAYVGSEIGARLDRADRIAANQAAQTALEVGPSGTTYRWRNPDTGHHGTITPTRTFEWRASPCREFTQTVYVDGRAETLVGTACRDFDGTWRFVG